MLICARISRILYFQQPSVKTSRPCFALLSFFLLYQQSYALDSDREQDINILSDTAIVNDKTGVTIYSGRVTIDQGTLHIAADEVKVVMSEREVLQFIASMKPQSEGLAHYEQQQQQNNDLVSADAKTITYFLQEERLHLAGKAYLKQSRDSFAGDLLHYDIAKGIVEATGGSEKSGDRVHVVISPKLAD